MASFLMCRPTYYGIEYEINPWMSRLRGADPQIAQAQWEQLYRVLTEDCGATVELVDPRPGLPDLVFTANAAFVTECLVVLSHFRFPARSGEEPVFTEWFEKHGRPVLHTPDDIFFEGAGDALRCGENLFCGYHFRSDIRSHEFLTEMLKERVLSLQLVDPRFYHLDTCFCPLADDALIYYPPAFDEYARRVIREHTGRAIEANTAEALRFGCNAVCLDRHVVLDTGCPELEASLRAEGYEPHPVDLSEYLKSGGAAKCLTLRLD